MRRISLICDFLAVSCAVLSTGCIYMWPLIRKFDQPYLYNIVQWNFGSVQGFWYSNLLASNFPLTRTKECSTKVKNMLELLIAFRVVKTINSKLSVDFQLFQLSRGHPKRKVFITVLPWVIRLWSGQESKIVKTSVQNPANHAYDVADPQLAPGAW